MKNLIVILVSLLLISQSMDTEQPIDSIGKLILQETMNSDISEDSQPKPAPILIDEIIKRDADTTGGKN